MGYWTLAKWIVGALLIAAFLALIAWAVHRVLESIRQEGRDEIILEDKPFRDQCEKVKGTAATCTKQWMDAVEANATLQVDVNKCQVLVGKQNEDVKKMLDRALAAQATTQRLLDVSVARSKESFDFITKTRKAGDVPAVSKEKECEEADAISRDAAARRLFYFNGPSGTTPNEVRPNNSGARSGSGALRVE
jgi:hypothetical protein